MDTVLYTVCAVAGWLALAYDVRLLRRDPSPARRALAVAVGCYAAGVTVAIPPVAAVVDAAVNVPNAAKFVAHTGVIGLVGATEVMLLYLTLPADQARVRARRRVAVVSAGFAVLSVLFVVVAVFYPDRRLVVEDARTPAVAAYLACYLLAVAVYAVDVTRLMWRYARVCHDRPWLRRGLLLTLTGTAFAMAYCVIKAGFIVAFMMGAGPAGERAITAAIITVGSLFSLTGLALPAFGPALVSPRRWWQRYRAYRALDRLWADVRSVRPQLVLDESLMQPVSALRDLDYALHRRITEIRDGQVVLRPYIERDVAALADALADQADLHGDDRQMVIDAAHLAAGIHAARVGAGAAQPAAVTVSSPPGGYDGEVAWLARVAQLYTDSPIIARVIEAATVRARTVQVRGR